MDTIKLFPQTNPPLNPASCARLRLKEDTRGQRGTEPGPRTVYKWFPAERKNRRVTNGLGY